VGGLAAVLVAIVSMSVATAQSNDGLRHLKLNVAKSTFSSGPGPKESTLTIEAMARAGKSRSLASRPMAHP
jgi:hypothetical protein